MAYNAINIHLKLFNIDLTMRCYNIILGDLGKKIKINSNVHEKN